MNKKQNENKFPGLMMMIVSIINSCLENQFIVCLNYDYFHCFNIILIMWAGESQFSKMLV